MTIGYDEFLRRAKAIFSRCSALNGRPEDLREAHLPVKVADRRRRAWRRYEQAMNAERRASAAVDGGHLEYHAAQMAKTGEKLTDAEHELDLADELIRELGLIE